MKFGELYSSFCGATLGAVKKGHVASWCIEGNRSLVRVAEKSIKSVIKNEDPSNINPKSMEGVDILHSTIACISKEENAKRAKTTIDFVKEINPYIVTIESGCSKCENNCMHTVYHALRSLGYNVMQYNINAALMGIPQTRQRTMIFAGRDGAGHNLDHCYKYFSTSWYSAIEDLIPYLEESDFEQWQLDAFRKEGFRPYVQGGMYIVSGTETREKNMPLLRWSHEPMFALNQDICHNPIRICVRYKNVVKLNTRAIARLQTFPDDFRLSGMRELDIIGLINSVPPLLYERFLNGVYY